MVELDLLKGSLNPLNVFKIINYRFSFRREHPDYFDPDGLCVFIGPQGSGKTLSAVQYVRKLLERYPKCILVSNLQLSDYPVISFEEYQKENPESTYEEYIQNNRVFPFNNNDDFLIYKNQDRGVIFLVDEIQLYLNSLESKNINMEVITQLSQQRKQRLHIVCTSQVFGRMAKPLREQFSCVILCSCLLSVLQCNKLIDRDSIDGDNSSGLNVSGSVKKRFFWFHSPEMYNAYDTYYVIERNKFVSGENQSKDLYSIDTIQKKEDDKK